LKALDALDKKDDYKSISNIGRPVSKPPTRAQIQSNNNNNNNNLSDVKEKEKEQPKRERSGSNSKARSSLNSTNKQSVISQNEFQQMNDNLNEHKSKLKISKLEQALSERDNTINSLKEQIIFLQKENMD